MLSWLLSCLKDWSFEPDSGCRTETPRRPLIIITPSWLEVVAGPLVIDAVEEAVVALECPLT